MDYDFLISELESKSNLKKDDVQSLVEKKYSEMNSFITMEGAVYLVAKEMNIDLPENSSERMPIKNIKPGMRNSNIIGRIFRISKITEFTKSNGMAGRVSNVFVGDGTGFVRVPLWDDQVKLLEDNTLSLGDVVSIVGGMARENMYGDTEISLGRFGAIHIVEDYTELPSVNDLTKMLFNNSTERTCVTDITPGGNFEIKGTVVQLFRGSFLFDICPMCGGKTDNSRCNEHGDVTPNHAMVLSFIVDDGTDSMRCVLFRETAEKLCGITAEELYKLDADQRFRLFEDRLLCKDVILAGNVKTNSMYDRMEMMVNGFKSINPLEESKKLVDDMEIAVGV